MDNKHLLNHIAKDMERPVADVATLVEALSNVIATQCGNLNAIAVPGFGTFEGKKRNERVVTNPGNGKKMLVPPKISLNFKVSNVLKNKIK